LLIWIWKKVSRERLGIYQFDPLVYFSTYLLNHYVLAVSTIIRLGLICLGHALRMLSRLVFIAVIGPVSPLA
jgi:hypothetical protein